MSKITDIIKNPGIIGKYINGVIHAKCKKEQVYQLAFVKEETLNMSMSVKPNNKLLWVWIVDYLAASYYISGDRGDVYKIVLDRAYVSWEEDVMNGEK